jgi:hypothetical protein
MLRCDSTSTLTIAAIIPLKHNGKYIYHPPSSKNLCILPTECICVFRMVLTVNSDYFPKQH